MPDEQPDPKNQADAWNDRPAAARNEVDVCREAYKSQGTDWAHYAAGIQHYFGRARDFLRDHTWPGMRVLDIGCASGFFTAGLAPSIEVVGLDITPEMVKAAGKLRPQGVYRVHDFHDPLPDDLGTFDVMLASSCFDFCRDVKKVLANLSEKLRVGGQLYFTIDERRPELPWHELHVRPIAPTKLPGLNAYFWSFEETVDALSAAGLRPVTYAHAPGWFNRSEHVEVFYAYWHATKPAPPSPASK